MLSGWKRGACLFWSLFFGVGTALFQVGYLRSYHHVNPFTLADLFVSIFMLASVAGMLLRRPWGDFLNALAWAVPLCGIRLGADLFCLLPGCCFPARCRDRYSRRTPHRASDDRRASGGAKKPGLTRRSVPLAVLS